MVRPDPRRAVAAILLLGGLAPASEPHEPDRRIAVEDARALESALAAARPGDRIELAPGRYPAIRFANVAGTADRPIVLIAANPLDPPVLESGLHGSDVSHLTISTIVVAGAPRNGINIDDGGSIETPSRFVRLERIAVRDVGGADNADGIKLSGVVDSAIVGCEVSRWGRRGSGIDLVGCHRLVIEDTILTDHEHETAASGIQAKGGSTAIVIRRCRFLHAGQRAVNIGGSTGETYFRPKDPGYEAKDVVVEGCTFEGSLAPIACVGSVGATIRFNTIRTPRKWVLRILQESRGDSFAKCRDGVFTRNLVLYDARVGAEVVNVGPGTAPETFVFAENYWYRTDDPARSIPALPTPEREPRGGVDPFAGGGDSNSEPEDGPARGYGAGAFAPPR